MINEQLLEKMSKDMQMRNFSKYTYYAYMHKGKEIIKYFNKPMEEVTTEELRDFLFNYLTEERKLAVRKKEKRNMNKLSEEQKEEIIKQYDKMVYNYVYGIYDQALNFVYMLENDEIDNVEIKFI